MADAVPAPAQPEGATAVLVLADGSVIWGEGFGAEGSEVGELCFNTAMTGYQEIMTDPSYASQIVTFTFPHIGNVGTNGDDAESDNSAAVGCIVRQSVSEPSNFRSEESFSDWMKARGRIGLAGVDTRALTRRLRINGAVNAVIAHAADGSFDIPGLLARAKGWAGLEGMDLAARVTRAAPETWESGDWQLGKGYQAGVKPGAKHVVVIDYGVKDAILHRLVAAGARVTIVPAKASADEICAHQPDGVLLSNGPGDPAATGAYAAPVIKELMARGVPLFGICLGHQLLALACGAQTVKMHQGHHGANHPVQRIGGVWGDSEGLVEITSMNHGFAVDAESLPEGLEETHRSLFDGSNCGLAVTGKSAFSVQYHPEASPGPQDSYYLFERFVGMLG